MKKCGIVMPSLFCRIIAFLLSVLLAVLLTANAALVTGILTFGDRALHISVATDDGILDMEMDEIGDTVDALAEEYHFSAETVRNMIDREAVSLFASDVVAWWTGTLSEGAETQVPVYENSELEQAIREDEGFQNANPKNRHKTLARDKIAAVITDKVTGTVIPVRQDLTTLLLTKGTEKLDVPLYAAYLTKLPWLLLAFSVLIACVIALLLSKRISESLVYIGGAIGAAAILYAAGVLALPLLDLKAFTGEISTLFSRQLELLYGHLRLRCLAGAAAGLVLGFVLIGLERKTFMKAMKQAERLHG